MFQKLLRKAKISSSAYPLKGTDLLLPLGKEILSNIEKLSLSTYKEIGYREVDLPSIVPAEMINHLSKEGLFKLNNKHIEFFLTPGYETQSVVILKNIVDNYEMFPIKIFKKGKAYRQDSKIHLIKNLELRIVELNSFFITKEEAEKELIILNEIAKKNLISLGIPYIKVKNSQVPTQYKFIGFFPHSGKFGTIIPTVLLGEKHSQQCNVFFKNKGKKRFYPIQVNSGFTGRILAAYLSNHMDKEKGFILDHNISPYEFIINELDFNEAQLANLKLKLQKEKISYLLLRKKSNNLSYQHFIATGIPAQIGFKKGYLEITERDGTVIRKNYNNDLKMPHPNKDLAIEEKKIEIRQINNGLKEYEHNIIYATTNPNFNLDNKLKFIGLNEENQKLFVKSKY